MTAKITGLLRRARTPRGCAVLLVLLLLDGGALAWHFRHDTAVSSVFRRVMFRDRPARRSEYVASIYMVRDGKGGFTFIDQQQSAGELASLSQNAPERVVSVSYFRGTWREGVWGPWWLRDLSTLQTLELTSNAAPAPNEEAACRVAFVGWLRFKGRNDLATLISSGDFNTTGLIWWGPIHDAVGVVLLLVLASCVPMAPGWVRERGVRAKLRRQVCPKCGYDLSATTAERGEKRCPECGRAWAMP